MVAVVVVVLVAVGVVIVVVVVVVAMIVRSVKQTFFILKSAIYVSLTY